MTFIQQRWIAVACLAAAALGGVIDAAAQGTSSRLQKSVELPELPAEELVVVALDSDVYEAASQDYSDVRLHDASSAAVPFLLRTAAETRTQSHRQYRNAPLRSARPLEDNALEILIDVPNGSPQPQGIRVVSPLKDFQHRMRVFASADGQQWEPVAEDGLIFDYSRFIDVRNDSVPFTESISNLKQLRIVIDDITAQQQSRLMDLTQELVGTEETARSERTTVDRRPLKVESVQLWHDVERQRVVESVRTDYPVIGMSVEQDELQGQTLITFASRREPLTQLTLVTPSRNFSRSVSVEVPQSQGVRTVWQRIGSGVISNLDFKDLQRQELSISFAESRHRLYRLVIDDRDSPPLSITDVRAQGSVKELVFFASPEQRVTLAYGHDGGQWKPPSFDSSAIAAALGEGYQPQRATLGTSVEHVASGDTPPLDLTALLNHPGVLLGVMSLLIVVLGWFLYQAGRRLDAVADENP